MNIEELAGKLAERVRERGFEHEAVSLIAEAFRGGHRVVGRGHGDTQPAGDEGPGAIIPMSVAPGSGPRLDPFGFSASVDEGTDPHSAGPDQPTTPVTSSSGTREVAGRRILFTGLEAPPDPKVLSSPGCLSGDEVEPARASLRAKGAGRQPTWSSGRAAGFPSPAEVPARLDRSRAAGGHVESMRDLVRSRLEPAASHRAAGFGDGPMVGQSAHRATYLAESPPPPVQRPDDRRTDTTVATVFSWGIQALLGRTPPSGGWPGDGPGLGVRVAKEVGLGAEASREERDGRFANRSIAPLSSAGGHGVPVPLTQSNSDNNSKIEENWTDIEGPGALVGRLFERAHRGDQGLFPSGMRSVYPLR
jgi:hypothetical protein